MNTCSLTFNTIGFQLGGESTKSCSLLSKQKFHFYHLWYCASRKICFLQCFLFLTLKRSKWYNFWNFQILVHSSILLFFLCQHKIFTIWSLNFNQLFFLYMAIILYINCRFPCFYDTIYIPWSWAQNSLLDDYVLRFSLVVFLHSSYILCNINFDMRKTPLCTIIIWLWDINNDNNKTLCFHVNLLTNYKLITLTLFVGKSR